MEAHLNADTVLAGLVKKKLDKLRDKREKAYWKVFRRAVNAKKINDVLIISNIPLELKYRMFDQLKQENMIEVDQVRKMLIYTQKFILLHTCLMCFFIHVCGGIYSICRE